MPFDRVIVSVALKTLKVCSVRLYFDFFREDEDGTRTKLAYGEHKAVWVTRDKDRNPVHAPFPDKIRDSFGKIISAHS